MPDEPRDRPELRPVDLPMVPFAVGGMAVWAVAGLVLLAFRDRLAAHGHTDYLWICLAGFLLGLPGLATMLVHDANRRRRRAATDAAPPDPAASPGAPASPSAAPGAEG